jgi:5-oxoprolinase (ATP-hydrolysing) subunit A
MTVDLNCDLGEIAGRNSDEEIMSYISSANIACGYHAGNRKTMEITVRLAIKYGVKIGAHPGYHDGKNFGRIPVRTTGEELRELIIEQVEALSEITRRYGQKLQHVKPHGALYNSASSDYDMALVIAESVKELDPSLILVGLSGSELISAAKTTGIPYASEVFADRAYNEDGTLISRSVPGSVLHDTGMVISRAVGMIRNRSVESINGKVIPVDPDTMCIHGDNEMAPVFARDLVAAFREEGIIVNPMIRG